MVREREERSQKSEQNRAQNISFRKEQFSASFSVEMKLKFNTNLVEIEINDVQSCV